MAIAEQTEPTIDEIAILARILSNGKSFSPTVARQLLKLGFSAEDRARMHELAVRNQSDLLSAKERQELHSCANAGCLLGILHSKARQALARSPRK
jgi:hypothetical protein